MGTTPDIFMAYASEDEEVSDFFKRQLEDAFKSSLTVFVASSNDGLTPGRVWFHELTQTLKTAKLVLAMVSRSALGTPWIPFECGTAFGADKTFIPLCHSGMRTDDLPPPLKHFQALNLAEERHLAKLFSVIKKELGLPDPNINLGSLSEYFEAADKAAAAWHKFNHLVIPMFWNDSKGFETLLRNGRAEILVSERHMDSLSFVSSFCRLNGIMSMELVDRITHEGDTVIHAAKGQRFSLLLSRKCALAPEFGRIRSAA